MFCCPTPQAYVNVLVLNSPSKNLSKCQCFADQLPNLMSMFCRPTPHPTTHFPRYNCSPRLACTGRRRHCYGLCKVTVYSANKDVAIVQFAGTHGNGALQRRVWPYNQYESIPVRAFKYNMYYKFHIVGEMVLGF